MIIYSWTREKGTVWRFKVKRILLVKESVINIDCLYCFNEVTRKKGRLGGDILETERRDEGTL